MKENALNSTQRIPIMLPFNPLVRMDKNLPYHYLTFKEQYSSDDTGLFVLLLSYFAKEKQNNLFGFGTLDPLKFCEEMELDPSNFAWRKHENPKHIRDLKSNTDLDISQFDSTQLFDTVLENALYCLSTDVFTFSNNQNYKIKKEIYKSVTSISSIQFLKKIEKVTVKGKTRPKVVYNYELNSDYIDNLSFLFFHANIKTLSNSMGKSLQGMYLHLCDLKNQMFYQKLRSVELDFTEVKNRLNINSDRADYVKQKINKAFDTLLSYNDLKDIFTIEWFKKPNQRYSYGIKLIYNGDLSDRIVEENKVSIWEDVRVDYLRTGLFEAYLRRYPSVKSLPMEELKERYITWLKSETLDEDTKKTVYIDCCVIFDKNNRYEKPGDRYPSFLRELPKYYTKFI